MFKYKFYEFFNKENEILTIQFENTKFLIGEFFSETSLINLCRFMNEKIKENKDFIKKVDWSFFPFNINIEENNDIKFIKEIFSDLKIIIIPNFWSIIGYILIYKIILEKENIFQINKETLNKIMIYSTEPIVQFAQSYLSEFYTSFNSLLINYTIKNNEPNENVALNKKINFINNNDIDIFLNHIISINYKEKINYLVPLSSNLNSLLNSQETSSLIEKYISFELCSNGYELGSSNILFHYYNKNIYLMTKSSIINDRYPLEFDLDSPKNCDFFLMFPEAINKNNNSMYNYGDNFKRLMETLMKSNNYEIMDINSMHYYPYTLILTYPFFMLEFSDVFKYKLKISKTVYFSDELEKEKNLVIFNDVIEFQNQLINMINNNIRDDSNMNSIAFNNLYNFGITQNTYVNKKARKVAKDDNDTNSDIKKDFVKNLIDKNCPFYFISHLFNLYNINNKDIINFFMNNYDNKYDKIILISNKSDFNNDIFTEVKNKLNLNGVFFDNYVLDYRLNSENLKDLIQNINPKFQLINEITDEFNEINLIYDDTYIDKNLFYKNSYLLSNNNKGILNQLTNNSELNLDFSKEQLRYNIILTNENNNINTQENKTKKGRKKKRNDTKEENKMNIEENEEVYDDYKPSAIEETEDILNEYLKINNMEITEYLINENNIEITIFNKIKKTYTEIKINNYYQEIKDNTNNNQDNEKENKKGRGSKSKSAKKSKTKEKPGNQMDLEEIKTNKKESEAVDDFPSIDINSEDTDDSLFLNTLFNSIFI